MRCPVCGKHLKPGTWNRHHYWFPKAKYKGTSEGRETVDVHVLCHKQFHYHFLNYCLRSKKCDNCRYTNICCYKRG